MGCDTVIKVIVTNLTFLQFYCFHLSENFTCLLDRYVNWSQGYFGINDPNTQFYIGNQYCKFWKNINEVRALSRNVSFV